MQLPTYDANNPSGWFAMCESIWELNRSVPEESMVGNILCKLPTNIFEKLGLRINGTPTSMAGLKERMNQHLTSTAREDFKKLLSSQRLGDRKPSEYYFSLQLLAASQTHMSPSALSEILREQLINALPSSYASVISMCEAMPVTDLLRHADLFHAHSCASAQQAYAVTSIAHEEPITHLQATELRREMERISTALDQLRLEIDSIRRTQSTSTRSRSQGRNSANNSKVRLEVKSIGANHNETLCSYHKRYGDKARYCMLPCHRHPSHSSKVALSNVSQSEPLN